MHIWDILWPLCTFCINLVHFFRFGVTCTKKNLATLTAGMRIPVEEQNRTQHFLTLGHAMPLVKKAFVNGSFILLFHFFHLLEFNTYSSTLRLN
jgi:hypothetical protein